MASSRLRTPFLNLTHCARCALITLLVTVPGCGRDPAPVASGPVEQASGGQQSELTVVQRASNALDRGDVNVAKELIETALVSQPNDSDVMAIAIEVYTQQREYLRAAALAEKFAAQNPEIAGQVMLSAYQWHLQLGDFSSAEAALRTAIQLQPAFVPARRQLAQLLNSQGRRFEAAMQTREVLRLEPAMPDDLLSMVDLTTPFPTVSYAEFEKSPTLSILGDARLTYAEIVQRQKSLKLARAAVAQFPKSEAAAAFLGRVLSDKGDLTGLQSWVAELPAGVKRHPEYWATLGSWLQQVGRNDEAIRAYCECLKRDGTDRQSLRGLIAALEATGNSSKTTAAKQTLAELDKIYRLAKNADAAQSRWIAETLQRLTRPWESSAWLERASRIDGTWPQMAGQFAQRRQAIKAWESSGDQDEIETVRLRSMLGFDGEAWPLPTLASLSTSPPPSSQDFQASTLRFQDVAQDRGLRTMFVSDYDLEGGKFYIYQANGGGLAALDYDLDGLCDVNVVQSGGTPGNGSTANQLFRQNSDGRFDETTAWAAMGDTGYGQGVCVADLNQDGFPDLLFANIGPNKLYLNQGDGTFRKSELPEFKSADDWTSSIAVGDLDGDALPEIVTVNYIDDPKAFEVACEGRLISCQPQEFRAEADRVLKNNGDGSFSEWSQVGGLPSYGFGVIIANLDGRNGNDVFVSNDGELNHLWVSETDDAAEESGGTPRASGESYTLTESAAVRGCSVGKRGRAQACMGVAMGDFDRNHKPDLHVTNFHNESVNLFLQQESGFFVDSALQRKLKTPSMKVLGFGTQATDFDNDGWLDLATLNGHLYDARYADIPFRMKPQLFRGSPDGFALQEESALADFGKRKALGRTLAILDWNRDGRMDLLANHLDRPIALLENLQSNGNWLQLRLVGAASERGAIGTEVFVRAGDESWTAWQVGGDGYMCTNEPIIHIGLGNQSKIDALEVRWPLGTVQVFDDVAVNDRYLIVEGTPEVFSVAKPQE